jgi:hypothetical protein
MLLVGAAAADITPANPMPLAGFGHRLKPFVDVARPIKVRALVFEREGVRAAVVSADLLGWSGDLVASLRPQIEQAIGVKPELLLLHATHTHCGPQVSSLVSLEPPSDQPYLAELAKRTVDVATRAAADLAPATASLGHSECRIGIHRRLERDGQIVMAPNPVGPIDPVVTVASFRRGSDRPPAFLVHYTCHPTTSDETRISPDYPGTALDQLETEWGEGSIGAFIQGCTGDIRPALTKDGNFYRGTQEDVDRLAAEFASAIRAAVGGEQTPLGEVQIEGRRELVDLPYARLPESDELADLAERNDQTGKWARYLLANLEWKSGHVELELARLTLAQGLGLLALNAEPVVAYGFKIRELSRGKVLPVGYSDALWGYLPTAAQLMEGGYEATGAFRLFGMPSPLAPSAEQLTVDAIRTALP